MNIIIQDLRNLELRICDRLTEVEQLELHNLITCAEQRIIGLEKTLHKDEEDTWLL